VYHSLYHGPPVTPLAPPASELDAEAQALISGSAQGATGGGLVSLPLALSGSAGGSAGTSTVVGSRTGYAGLSDAQARALLGQTDGALLSQTDDAASSLAAGWQITGYLGDSAARVVGPDGKHAVLDSSLPLLGKSASGVTAPVDLSLIDAGSGFAPAVTPAAVQIPSQLSAGVQLPALGLTVTPVDSGGTPLSSGGVASAAAVSYANTQTDADTIVKPTSTGVDVLGVLRSPQSPQQLYYRLSLPAGASLAADAKLTGAFDVLNADGSPIAIIMPPVASDASGTAVPATMSVEDGDTLEVSLNESAGSYEYPITVDPDVVDSQTFGATSPGLWWTYASSSDDAFSPGWTSSGMSMCACNGFSSGEWGAWNYVTQGDSYVYATQFWGLYQNGSGTSNVTDYLREFSGGSPAGTYDASSGFQYPYTPNAVCLDANCDDSTVGTAPSSAQFWTVATGSGGTDFAAVSGADVYIAQNTLPTLSGSVSGCTTPSGWYASGTLTLFCNVSDLGIGVYHQEVDINGHSGAYEEETGSGCYDSVQCPENYGKIQVPASDLPNGIDVPVGAACTAAATVVSSTQCGVAFAPQIGIDNSPPQLVVNGTAAQNGGTTVAGTYTLQAMAKDGYSGLAFGSTGPAIAMTLDGKPIGGSTGVSNCTSLPPISGTSSCSDQYQMTATASIELGAGTHVLAVTATSGLGKQQTWSETLNVRAAASEQVGPGTVDLNSGNYTLGATDVDIPAPGQDLVVSRSYASRTAYEVDGAVGPDWLLSLPSPAQKWQSLTIQSVPAGLPSPADGLATLTDIGNDQLTFDETGSGSSATFATPSQDAGLTLSVAPTGACASGANTAYVLTDSSGDSTTFVPQPSSSTTNYVPACVTTASASQAVVETIAYEQQTQAAGTETVPEDETVGPSSLNCGTSFNPSTPSSLPAGCRALTFSYDASATGCSSVNGLGNKSGELSSISYAAYDTNPADTGTYSTVVSTPVACYFYDSNGYLGAEYDPRLGSGSSSVLTTYGYTNESPQASSQLTSLTEPGEEPWTFTYGSVSNTLVNDPSANRLLSASQCDPTQSTGGSACANPDGTTGRTATWSVYYGVPLTGTGTSGAPPNMSASTVADWGEGTQPAGDCPDIPLIATAVFRPSEPQTVATLQSGAPADYNQATIYYMDYDYRLVNVASEPSSTTTVTSTGASYPSGIWMVSTAQYDVADTQATTWSLNGTTLTPTYTATSQATQYGCTDPSDAADRSDSYDNVVSTLSATNRASAYVAGGDTWGSASAAAATPLESTSVYNTNSTVDPTNADGEELLSTTGPAHTVQLSSSSPGTLTQARQVASYSYDANAPNYDYNPAAREPFQLVTQVQTWAQPTSGGQDDIRTTTTGYSALAGYSGPSQTLAVDGVSMGIGWALGEPTWTSVTASTAQTLTTGTAYDPVTGAAIDSIQPVANSLNPSTGVDTVTQNSHDSETILYSTGSDAQPGAPGACQNEPAPAMLVGMVCATVPAAQPSGAASNGVAAALPSLPQTGGKVSGSTLEGITYNVWDDPLQTEELAWDMHGDEQTRTTIDAYDGAGRVDTSQTTSTIDGTGTGDSTPQPQVQTYYNGENDDVHTELNGQVSKVCDAPSGSTYGSGCTKTISYTYDPLGRLATYTDANGNTAVNSYDIDGRLLNTTDGKGYSSGSYSTPVGADAYAYDPTTGELTSLCDQSTQANTGTCSSNPTDSYSATYGPDGQLASEAMSNGLTASYSYDQAGEPTNITYTKTTGCSANCAWLSDSAQYSINGQITNEKLTDTAKVVLNSSATTVNQNVTNVQYTYDGAGRLATAANTPSPGIQLNAYGVPTANSGVTGIVTGGDGNLWYTESNTGKIVRITPSGQQTEFSGGMSSPAGPALGPDGNVWFTDHSYDAVGYITQSGVVHEYGLAPAAGPGSIAPGPGGNTMVFTDESGNAIGTINTTSHAITTTALTGGAISPEDIVQGSDGNDYFVDLSGTGSGAVEQIGEITSSGTITETPLETGSAPDWGWGSGEAAASSNGTIWFNDDGNRSLVEYNVNSHAVNYFWIPSDMSYVHGLTLAADGTLWFTEGNTGEIAQLSTAGGETVTEYTTSPAADGSMGITQGPDGNIWFVDSSTNDVYQVTSGATSTRTYTFDADTNRTKLVTTVPSSASACAYASECNSLNNPCPSEVCTTTNQTNGYDQADRLNDTGIAYDPFGDITSMPSSDAGGTSLSATYYSDGTNNTLTQGSTKVTNDLDPEERTSEQITAVSGTTTHDVLNYYDNGGTSPAYDLDQTTNTEHRYIPDITGNVAAIWTDNLTTNTPSLTYQLNDLQGSIVAQASSSTSATDLQSVTPVTEYGVPTTNSPAKYSWLGGKERDTELASGIVGMGDRVYDPYTGTFLQTDPEPGADLTAYGYANGDPVNDDDLDGNKAKRKLRPQAVCQVGASLDESALQDTSPKVQKILQTLAPGVDAVGNMETLSQGLASALGVSTGDGVCTAEPVQTDDSVGFRFTVGEREIMVVTSVRGLSVSQKQEVDEQVDEALESGEAMAMIEDEGSLDPNSDTAANPDPPPGGAGGGADG